MALFSEIKEGLRFVVDAKLYMKTPEFWIHDLEGEFVSCNAVATTWSDDGPYHFGACTTVARVETLPGNDPASRPVLRKDGSILAVPYESDDLLETRVCDNCGYNHSSVVACPFCNYIG